MRNYFIILIILFTNTLAYGQGISVSPSRIFFTGQPGQTLSETITFSNTSSDEFYFVATIKDWNRDSLGVKKYYPMGNVSHSNAAWLSLSENTVKLAPGETKQVNVSMTVPNSEPTALSHSMLFFTQVKQQQAAAAHGLHMNILVEVGIQIYHTPTGLKAGDLEFLAFEDKHIVSRPGEQAVRRIDVKIKNTGQINKDAYVRFELTNMETGEEIPIEATAIAMLPHSEQWVQIELPEKLTAGKYLAVAILDAGSQYDLKIAEKEITY